MGGGRLGVQGPGPPVALHAAAPDSMNSPEQHGKLMRRRP